MSVILMSAVHRLFEGETHAARQMPGKLEITKVNIRDLLGVFQP